MNPSANCGNCRYWNKITGESGLCQKKPPQAQLAMVPNKLNPKEQIPQPISFWPPVSISQWCGEHEMDLG